MKIQIWSVRHIQGQRSKGQQTAGFPILNESYKFNPKNLFVFEQRNNFDLKSPPPPLPHKKMTNDVDKVKGRGSKERLFPSRKNPKKIVKINMWLKQIFIL